MENNKYTFFWETKYVFSNWHPAKFVMNGIKFGNSEQAFMYYKAKLFGDEYSMEKILKNSDPRKVKQLGREISGFDEKIWDENKFQIMYNVNYAKYSQNPKMLNKLISTKGTNLVEASPFDNIWGIGLFEIDAKRLSPNLWPGKNLLGKVLDKVRDDLDKLL